MITEKTESPKFGLNPSSPTSLNSYEGGVPSTRPEHLRASTIENTTAQALSIALLPGDGIGPEVLQAAVMVLDETAALCGIRLRYEEFSVGATEFLRSGDPLPKEVFDRVVDFDAILLGAMGIPGVRWPSGIEMTPQIDLRERLDL